MYMAEIIMKNIGHRNNVSFLMIYFYYLIFNKRKLHSNLNIFDNEEYCMLQLMHLFAKTSFIILQHHVCK